MPIKDPVKRAAYAKKYREEHREDARERTRKWVEENKERSLESCRQYYLKHKEERTAQIRAYEKTEEGRKKKREWYKRSFLKHHDHYLCRDRFKKAIAKGWIVRKPCSVCGNPDAQGHHEDYSKPYEVIWFCDYHHKVHEGKIIVSKPSISTQADTPNQGSTQWDIQEQKAL